MAPATLSWMPARMMTITCKHVKSVPDAQYTDRSFPRWIHSPAYRSLLA